MKSLIQYITEGAWGYDILQNDSVRDELCGKEVIDADIQIVGKISDAIFDKDTFELTDIVIKKTGFSEQIKASENVIPIELIKVIGDKVLLKGEDDI